MKWPGYCACGSPAFLFADHFQRFGKGGIVVVGDLVIVLRCARSVGQQTFEPVFQGDLIPGRDRAKVDGILQCVMGQRFPDLLFIVEIWR